MLSIGKLAAGQERYYENTVAKGLDDYYTGRGEAPGRWLGTGAAQLGLTGEVEDGQLSALMAGRDPGTGPTLRAPATQRCPSRSPGPDVLGAEIDLRPVRHRPRTGRAQTRRLPRAGRAS